MRISSIKRTNFGLNQTDAMKKLLAESKKIIGKYGKEASDSFDKSIEKMNDTLPNSYTLGVKTNSSDLNRIIYVTAPIGYSKDLLKINGFLKKEDIENLILGLDVYKDTIINKNNEQH